MSRKIKIGSKNYDIILDRHFLESKVRETISSLVLSHDSKTDYSLFLLLKENKNKERSFVALLEAKDYAWAIEVAEKEIRKCYWILTSSEGDEPIYTGFNYFSDETDFYIMQKISKQRIWN